MSAYGVTLVQSLCDFTPADWDVEGVATAICEVTDQLRCWLEIGKAQL
jgi:hypothetical protein